MTRYIMRLDDACPKRNVKNWDRMESLLDAYGVKPLIGIIPDCKDPNMDEYEFDPDFWSWRVKCWQEKGYQLALHGFNHVFRTNDGGVNPVNKRSEFAGVPYEDQKRMIGEGVAILRKYGVNPKVFFAPAHTFDNNTIEALKEMSDIRIISDTPSFRPYKKYGMTFIPQQSGVARELPFDTVTFCYHPNVMTDKNFERLELFLRKHSFVEFPLISSDRDLSFLDRLLMKVYYAKHR